MRAITDEQFRVWTIAIRDADRSAFGSLFDATYDGLHRYAAYIVRDEHSASDLVQDVFAKVWQIRDSLDPERSLKALLFQMVRNQSLNHERRKKRHQMESLDGVIPTAAVETETEEDLDAQALARRIQEWIDEMPERRREAFLLSRREGLSHEQIAQLMGLAPKTVNNHIVLALTHIRQRLAAFREISDHRE